MTPKSNDPMDRAGSVELYGLLSAPMPEEALSGESSRGFELTSIKAGFVIERLNECFGLLGYGWRYAHGPHRQEGDEVLVPVAVQWRVIEEPEGGCCPPVYWGRQVDATDGTIGEGWQPDKDMPAVWSEPVFATGGSSLNRKGGLRCTDAFRGAVTNGITKAASRLGVGIEVWKGECDNGYVPGNSSTGQKSPPKRKAKRAPRKTSSTGYGSLEAMQKAAQAEYERLTKVKDGLAQATHVQPLVHKMNQLGIDLPRVNFLWLLLGQGDTTIRRVMACYNFLQANQLSEDDVEILCREGRRLELPTT